MDSSVIKKLADIDLAARSILDDARAEQTRLAETYRKKTEDFDRQAEEESEQRLEKTRSDLERENSEAIAKLEDDMEKTLSYIEKNYANQVDACADEIVARILEATEL